jgi:hypothetical protein
LLMGDAVTLNLSGVLARPALFKNRSAIEVTMPASASQDPAKEALKDRNFMAWRALDFTDGTVELDVASVIASGAPAYARGFIGVAFRVESADRFESVYLRPANSRCDDQVRRNHTIQYAAYPDFTFDRLRTEAPEKYESYADVALEEWIHLEVQVQGSGMKLFINNATHPALIVNDLKHGANARGGIGLWIESGTIGYFADVRVGRVAI